MNDAVTDTEVPGAGDFRADPDAATPPGGQVDELDLLQTIVDLAVAGLGGVTAASVSVATPDPGGYVTLCATDPAVKEVDEVQYRTGGPCVDAISGSSEVMLTLPSGRWPEFSRAAAGAGTTAVWSLPLEGVAEVGASLNLYASTPAPWTAESARIAPALASKAATILAHRSALARCEELNATLQRALDTRTVIGQAQGVLMARQRIGADEAFEILRRASQRTNRKLRDIAADIVSGMTGERPD